MYNSKMALKPQDIVVLLKLCGYANGIRPAYSAIASELNMSASEVHGAVKRLKDSQLLHSLAMDEKPNLTAVEEFLIHGLRYSFPEERGKMTRGIPTSYAAEPLCNLITIGDEPVPVWAYPQGTIRGISVVPLYKTVPDAALKDPILYQRLALIDAIRGGRARDRKLAEQELHKSLNQVYA
jgi:DNA-binding Lrp family transcriptional regulator